jgi:hypothetical protein
MIDALQSGRIGMLSRLKAMMTFHPFSWGTLTRMLLEDHLPGGTSFDPNLSCLLWSSAIPRYDIPSGKDGSLVSQVSGC